jgi:hypothetical protein
VRSPQRPGHGHAETGQGSVLIFASGIAAAVGSVLAARLEEFVPGGRLIAGLLVLSSLAMAALA